MLYGLYQSWVDVLEPLRTGWALGAAALRAPRAASGEFLLTGRMGAACEVLSGLRMTHVKPAFGIDSVRCGHEDAPICTDIVHETPFGALRRFRRADAPADRPRVMLVAPISGHFATLLRGTLRTLLRDHDVYLTDWSNARDVPPADGRFGLDDFIAHLITWFEVIGPGGHLVAVCQPCGGALAAVALMAEDGHAATPSSMTLMAGPVDARINPTRVNELATSRPIDWFERNLIARVPWRYAGAGRRVYPGFVQLTAFMQMNRERHFGSFVSLYRHLVDGEPDRAGAIRDFYDEYFAVMDLPAEFYLETVDQVFQRFTLARGCMRWRGRPVNPAAIRRTALMTVEGERDDICALGQTLAAQDLCGSLPQWLRAHHVQAGVGHYGVFSGRRWENELYPRVKDFISAAQA
ncbi:MAG: polyhydroxyalkanoate depolymerase [Gammaproteobacteria bacterium]